MESVVQTEVKSPIRVAYERRTRDLDPQLVWRGKDEQDWSDLVVHAPPLYIQEKVHPKVLVDDLFRQTMEIRCVSEAPQQLQLNLFADFNGVPDGDAKTEFYQDKKKVRVAGPFTVESPSPHRTLGVDEIDTLIDTLIDPLIDTLIDPLVTRSVSKGSNGSHFASRLAVKRFVEPAAFEFACGWLLNGLSNKPVVLNPCRCTLFSGTTISRSILCRD